MKVRDVVYDFKRLLLSLRFSQEIKKLVLLEIDSSRYDMVTTSIKVQIFGNSVSLEIVSECLFETGKNQRLLSLGVKAILLTVSISHPIVNISI